MYQAPFPRIGTIRGKGAKYYSFSSITSLNAYFTKCIADRVLARYQIIPKYG